MDINIRNAREKDYDKIISLLYDIALQHSNGRPDMFSGGFSKYTNSELQSIAVNPETPVFVATDATETVLGYIFCQIKNNPAHGPVREYKSLYIDDLCVDTACRGAGIGKKLFEHAVKFAKSNGCYCLDLNVWEFNKSAIAFYEKLGMSTRKRTMEFIL